jgi:hypothetical protein
VEVTESVNGKRGGRWGNEVLLVNCLTGRWEFADGLGETLRG